MTSATPRSLDFRLPRALFYVYLAGPILSAPLLLPQVFEVPLPTALWYIAGSFIPFLAIPAALHPFYAFVVPRLLARWGLGRGPLVLHAAMSAAVAIGVALLIRPLHSAFYPRHGTLFRWLATCVVITWAHLLPTILMQSLRVRAYEAERRLLEERQAALRAQLEALQSRTNPHFLFNALNTIASLIPDEPQLAEATVERLADLLRYALESSRHEHVPLGRELAMLGDYLEVQKARFGTRLVFGFDVEDGLHDMQIPPLLLQPLVENAVLHGVAGRNQGGRVTLTAARTRPGSAERGQQESVEFRIDDDGPGPGGSTHRGSGTSLVDLERRIELVYGRLARLTTERNDSGGFSARLLLPVGATP